VNVCLTLNCWRNKHGGCKEEKGEGATGGTLLPLLVTAVEGVKNAAKSFEKRKSDPEEGKVQWTPDCLDLDGGKTKGKHSFFGLRKCACS